MNSKRCTRCEEIKLYTEFYQDKDRIDGYRCECKSCKKSPIIKKTYPKIINKEVKKAYNKLYKLMNADRIKSTQKAYNIANKDKLKSARKIYDLLFADKRNDYQKRYHLANVDKIRSVHKIYNKTNRGKINALSAKRKASKFLRTPKWLTEDHLLQIRQFYIDASLLTKSTGVKYEVDHIIPLQNKLVSGMHVPWNLQILHRDQNRIKSNRFDGTNNNEKWLNELK